MGLHCDVVERAEDGARDADGLLLVEVRGRVGRLVVAGVVGLVLLDGLED